MDPIVRQPSDLTPNVAVRDAAHSVLETAADRGTPPDDVTSDRFRPPCASQWRLQWSTEADIGPYDVPDYPQA